MDEERVLEVEQHLIWMSKQTAVQGEDLQIGVEGALEIFRLLPKRADGSQKLPGAYSHRTNADDARSVVQITPLGVLLFMGTDAVFSGEHAVQYMAIGEWLRLPDPPGGEAPQS